MEYNQENYNELCDLRRKIYRSDDFLNNISQLITSDKISEKDKENSIKKLRFINENVKYLKTDSASRLISKDNYAIYLRDIFDVYRFKIVITIDKYPKPYLYLNFHIEEVFITTKVFNGNIFKDLPDSQLNIRYFTSYKGRENLESSIAFKGELYFNMKSGPLPISGGPYFPSTPSIKHFHQNQSQIGILADWRFVELKSLLNEDSILIFKSSNPNNKEELKFTLKEFCNLHYGQYSCNGIEFNYLGNKIFLSYSNKDVRNSGAYDECTVIICMDFNNKEVYIDAATYTYEPS